MDERIRERPDRPDDIGNYAIYESGDWLLPLADFLDKYDKDWEKLCAAERDAATEQAAQIAEGWKSTVYPKKDIRDEIWESSCNDVAQSIAAAIRARVAQEKKA